jgi:hypothetical protein
MWPAEHWVSVSPDRDPEPVRRFGCLPEMGLWLVEKGVRSVAVQSTGVYFALSSALIGRVQVPPALL